MILTLDLLNHFFLTGRKVINFHSIDRGNYMANFVSLKDSQIVVLLLLG